MNQQINAVEWNETIDGDYGFAVMRLFKPTIVAWGTSTTLPILKKSLFERIEIPVAPLELQRQFAERVSRVEQVRHAGASALVEMAELFDSIQSRAFRGEL